MAKINRRRFLKGSAVAAAAVATTGPWAISRSYGADAKYVLKFANNKTNSDTETVNVKKAAEKIREETNGQVKIEMYTNSVLGGDTQMLSQLRAGAIDFFTLSPLILSTLVPVAAINGVGFAFSSYDQVWPAMDGKLGAFVRSAISKHGLYCFSKIWDNGFREITSSSSPIRTPDDLEGFKIRVPIAPLWTSMFKAFGASPTSLNWNEVYTALQTGVVSGQENPLSVILEFKIYEVQKYCSMTNHMWDGFWFLANDRKWQGLPEDIRHIIETNMNAACLKSRKVRMHDNTVVNKDKLAELGMVFNAPDTEPFRQKLTQAGFYEHWKEQFGDKAWGLLEEYVGSLA